MSTSTRTWGIVASYVCVVVLCTWPALLAVKTQVIGAGGDPWQTMWRFEDTQRRLVAAWKQNEILPFVTQEFLGGGETRLVNISVWPWLWLHAVVGQPLAYNLIWLASFVLSGCAMYALVRFVLRDSAPESVSERILVVSAWLAGLYYMLLPYHMAHALGHFGAMQTFWLPLLFLLLFSYLKQPRVIVGIALAAVAAVQTWTEHHYGLWFALAGVVMLIWHRRATRHLVTRRHLPLTIATVVLAAVLTLVPYGPTIREGLSTSSSLVLEQAQTIRLSADPFAYVFPHAFHSIWGKAAATFFTDEVARNITETTQYVGLTILLLVIFFQQRIPAAQKRWWGLLAMLFFVLSLGPRLQLLGRVLPVPLPYALLDNFPVFDAVRSVGRAGVMVGLALTVLLGLVAATQFKRTASFIAVACLIVLEFISVPIPTQSAQLSPAYRDITTLPGARLIEIPAATNYTAASRALFASLVHGKEVVGGIALERGQDIQDRTVTRSLPALRHLLYLGTNTLQQERSEFFDQNITETFWDTVDWLDAAAVVIHTDSVNSEQLDALRHFLETQTRLEPRVYNDIVVYPLAGVQPAHDGVFLWRREGWDAVVYDAVQDKTLVRFSGEAQVTVVNIRDTAVPIELSFASTPTTGLPHVHTSQGISLLLREGAAGRSVVALKVLPGETTLIFTPSTEGTVLENPQLRVLRTADERQTQ